MSHTVPALNGLWVNLKPGKPTLITLDQISHFAAADKYGEIHMRDGKIVLIQYAIRDLAKLYPDQFIMIRRNTVVRRSDIVSIHTLKGTARNFALMKSGQEFEVSRRHAVAVRKMLRERAAARRVWTLKEGRL